MTTTDPLGLVRRRLLWMGGATITTAGLLAVLSLVSLASEREARRQMFAERIFDAMEREMSALVSREDARPFYQYRTYYYAVGERGESVRVRSPLADEPSDAWIVGWYQQGPSLTLSWPLEMRDGRFAASARVAERALLSAIGTSPGSSLEILPEAPVSIASATAHRSARLRQVLPQPPQQAPELLLNTAGTERREQAPISQQANFAQIAGFTNAEQGVAERQATLGAPVGGEPETAPSTLDVDVSPFKGINVGEHLVLQRAASPGGQLWRQGLVLDTAAWRARLRDEVIVRAGLDPLVELSWEPGSDGFSHTFAPPFDSWTVTASVGRLPEAGTPREVYVLGLAALVVVVTGGGLVAVWRSTRAAMEYGQRRADFAATVTHELKTPLTTIRMYSEMLEGGMVPDAERQRQYHGRIRGEAERLAGLVDSVLSSAKLQKGMALPQGGPAPLSEVLEALDTATAGTVQAQGFELVVRCEVPRDVSVPRDALVQVLANLVDNATKFAAGATDRRIELRVVSDGAVKLTIRDHGPGVDPEELPRLFDPFYRPRTEMMRQTRGAGLGLSIVKGLVQQIGGSVSARNHPDGGFEVTVAVPGA